MLRRSDCERNSAAETQRSPTSTRPSRGAAGSKSAAAAEPWESLELAAWYEGIVARAVSAYKTSDFAPTLRSTLATLDAATHYTIVIGSDLHIQVLLGVFPPLLLEHLIANTYPIALPTPTHDVTVLHGTASSVRVGRVKVDLTSSIVHENVVLYRGRTRLGSMSTPLGRFARPAAAAPNKGAVSRFAKRMEMIRMLRHR